MEELKNKILSLINKQTPKIPSMGFSDANYHFNDTPTLSINSKTVAEPNRRSDQDILESIEAAYFSLDENYDIIRFELSKIPEQLDCGQITRDFENLKQQHQVVSKKVLQLILEHQSSCNEEFKHVVEILDKVKQTSELCTKSRTELNTAKREYERSLSVLANYRKRKLVQSLLNNLKMIKNLYNFDKRLNVLLNQGDYVGAISELRRCQKVANDHKNFKCVAALTHKLQETMENTDNQLDRALAQTCLYFNGDHFGKLQNAFRLMEKSQSSVIDNLHVHYITAISNQSMSVIQSYVDNCELILSDNIENPYETLCQSVPRTQDVFIRCLLDLCKVLFKIVLSYHQLINWYGDYSDNSPDRQKVKLETNLTKIWDDVQRKVRALLSNVDLTQYGIDQFVQVLRIVHRLIQVGDEFCMSKSENLMRSIEVQCEAYFKNYHTARMDELRIVFENEIWEICPVKSTFNILQLREFQSLRSLLRNFKLRAISHVTNSPQVPSNIPPSVASTDCCSSTHSQDGCSSIYGNYFMRYANHGTPFDCRLDETIINEDMMDENDASGYFSEDSDEESEEIQEDSNDEVEENVVKTSKKQVVKNDFNKAPILTNTTLQVIHQIGKYLQMSRLLKPIAHRIVMSMNEFFYYYLYVVNLFFTADLPVSSGKLYSAQLSSTLRRIEQILGSEGVHGRPKLSALVDLSKREQLHGLCERIVAVESLVYLSSQYSALQEFVEFLIPQTSKPMLDNFIQLDVACVVDIRKPVYMSVCAQAFDLVQILSKMSKINWEIKEVREQHNDYIDILLREIQVFVLRLEKISSKLQIPNVVYTSLWENIMHIITHTLVQGFAEAKKCSNAGRALMQLDFAQFQDKFEKISGMKPVPHKAYVDNYLKAYYLPEYELENWISEHNEYSTKHFHGLVSCVCQNNKKTRLRLEQMIDEMEKNYISDR